MASSLAIVFLVHGTWPRGIFKLPLVFRSRKPLWFEQGSIFRRDLENRLAGRVQFEVLNWSGRNSVRARSKAAAALRERILEAQRTHPHLGQIIVAHSHGGNVALQALAHFPALKGLLGVATMGTPLLQFRERPLDAFEQDSLKCFGGVIGFFLTMFALWLLDPAPGISTLSVIVISLALFLSSLALMWKLVERLKRWSKSILRGAPMPAMDDLPPVFLLRVQNDEAERALTLAKSFGKISRRLWSMSATYIGLIYLKWCIYRRGLLVYLTAALSGAWVGVFMMIHNDNGSFLPRILYHWFGYDLDTWVVLLALVFVLLPFALASIFVPLFVAMISVLLVPFGYEMALLGLLLDVGVEGLPPTNFVLEREVDVPSRMSCWSLRHSVHEFPEARAHLAMWIAGRLQHQ